MGILDLFRRTEVKTVPDEVVAAQTISIGMEGSPDWPRASVDNFIREGYNSLDLIYSCIRKIANSAAHARMIHQTQQEMGQEVEEIVRGSVAMLMREPNEDDTQFEFLDFIQTSLQVSGNAYVFKERVNGRVVNLWPIAPQEVGIFPSRRGVRAWAIKRKGVEMVVPAEDVGQMKFTNLSAPWFGLAPLQVSSRIANLDVSATEFSKVFFKNAGIPRGLLKVKRRLDQKQADEIRALWKARMSGINRHEIAVLDENAEYEKIGSGLESIELEDLRDLTESRICSVHGVPPILVGANVGLKRGTYSNYEEARESFWQETLLPLYRRIGDFMTKIVRDEYPAEETEIGFDFSGVAALQESETEHADAMRIKATTATLLISAGFERAAVLESVGLPDMPVAEIEPAPMPSEGEPGSAVQPPATRSLSERKQREIEQIQAAEFTDAVDEFEEIIEAAFTKQVRDANAVMGRYIAEEQRNSTKTIIPFDASGLIPPTADDDLVKAVRPILLDVMARSWVAIEGSDVLGTLPFDAEAPAIQQVLRTASSRVVGINDTTRKSINEILSVGESRGYSIEQIAKGVDKDDFRGIRSVIQETYKNRSRTIARTEVRTAQNMTTAARYEASGVRFVEIRDGDDDPECAAVNGTRQTTAWYSENPTAHPNCTRGAIPVIETQPALTGTIG